MMTSGWFGLLLGGALWGVFAVAFHHYVMRAYKARSWLSRGAVLVDVDDPDEYAFHHPRVAINLPLEDLARRADELGARGKPLVVFAHSWRRGARAARELRGIGFMKVMNAAGLRTKEQLSAQALRIAEEEESEDQQLIELAPDRE